MTHAHVQHGEMRRDALLVHIADHLDLIDRKLTRLMASQADIETAVAALTASVATIQTAIGTITTEGTELSAGLVRITEELARLAALVAAGGTVDLTTLDAIVAQVQTTADNLTAQTAALATAADAVEAIVPPV